MISNITTIDTSRESQKDESMELIKKQNLKIKNLYCELEYKDNLITKYLTEMKKFSKILDENNELKNQLNNFKSNINCYNNEINSYKIKEVDKENFIKILQNNLQQSKNNLIEYENKFNDINLKNKNNIDKINLYEKNEQQLQNKAKELCDIIKQQEDELIKRINQINDISKKYIELKNTIDEKEKKYNELFIKHNEKENIINHLNDNINKLQKNINNLNSEKNNLLDKIELNDINNKNLNSNILETINYFCSSLNNSINWMDTYLLENNDSNNNLENDSKKNIEESLKILFTTLNKNHNENNISNSLISIHQRLNNKIKDIYLNFNAEINNKNKIIKNFENEKKNFLYEIEKLTKENENLNKNYKSLQNDYYKIINQLKNNELNLNNINEKKNDQNKKLEEVKKEIFNFYDNFANMMNKDMNKLKTYKLFNDLFKNINLNKPKNDILDYINKIKEISFNFYDICLYLIDDINTTKSTFEQFKKINYECLELKKEILQVRKGYNNKKFKIENEKENEINFIKQKKNEEIIAITNDFNIKNNQLNEFLKFREDEIEKLKNDYNLLYTQYKLSEKNFDEYKKNKNKNDIELEKKYEETKNKLIVYESDNNSLKNQIDILVEKNKNLEEILNKKKNENIELQKNFDLFNK